MTATTAQPSQVRRDRRIIERPRLIKMLDETDARVILLLAPAGYGKTTLARQWAKTLNGAIWVSLTPAHRDVATLADDIADGLGAFDEASRRFVNEFVRARSNPQRAAHEIGRMLATKIESEPVQWLLLDDYQEVAESPESDELLRVLIERTNLRILVASRTRPRWATSRLVVYDEIKEVHREDLAMTPAETTAVVGRRPDLEYLATRAEGWPAVVTLAARLPAAAPPAVTLPLALHEYVAQELFTSMSATNQQALLSIALLPDVTRESLARRFGASWMTVAEMADELGFVRGEPPDLHPLLREFLLAKLRDEPNAETRIVEAIDEALEVGAWEVALDLVTRFDVRRMFESVLGAAYEPLLRSGRIGTLARFAQIVRKSPSQPPPIVDLIDAEVALCDGQFELAAELSERVVHVLPPSHSLASRAATIAGHSNFFLIRFEESEQAFEAASARARDERDISEALHGLAVTKIFGELPGAQEAVALLSGRRHRSPTDLARYLTDELCLHHFEDSLGDPLQLDRARHAMESIEDPRARTALSYRAAYALAQRADYRQSEEWLAIFFADAIEYVLDFTMPYAWWVEGTIHAGLRRFGLAERAVQQVEDAAASSRNENHQHNARALRARLLLQTGKAQEAVEVVSPDPRKALIPSWHAEYLATRALACACVGDTEMAERSAKAAEERSRALEVRLLALSARAVTAAIGGGDASFLMEEAASTSVWDPVLCALRASQELATQVAANGRWRQELTSLYGRSNDLAMARRAGFRQRTTQRPHDVLSPRELEVLGLIARGFRNRDIARALFIAESTTKVHVRHVLEKLGVKTRAEAVARYEMFARETTVSSRPSVPPG